MIPYPQIDPDIISIGPVHIRWYGMMYVLGFLAAYLLIQKQKRARQIGLIGTVAQDYVFYVAIGLIVGARLGYVIFYQYNDYLTYLKNPLEIVATWHGGMSFHGGLIGGALATWIFCRRRHIPFLAVADCTVVTAPIGLGLGRIGNFINGELLGRTSDVPWAMVFPDGGPLPRHPSQLYEALMEGVVLFTLLWILRQRSFRDGMMIVFFVFFYGFFRFFLEFFREPDPQIGFLLGYFTMGQLLCVAMMAASGILALYLNKWLPSTAAPGEGQFPHDASTMSDPKPSSPKKTPKASKRKANDKRRK
jgi:phosphatidylglycerol:prolipoprotein diacylglycerol transferase